METLEYICQRHGEVAPDRIGTRKDGGIYCRDCASLSTRRSYRRKKGLDPDARLNKGGKYAEIGDTSIKDGYVVVKVGLDKSAHHRAANYGWVLQHILVAEEKYGFAITRDFTIHHRNGNRQDNRPENLELRVGPHGKGGDLIHTLLADEENRLQAVAILREYGYAVTA